MSEERWATIGEFPNYAVSDHGRVMNLKTHSILRPRDNSYGYVRVALRRDGKTFERYVHQLVAAAFISGYEPGVEVRHVEENGDNSVLNLRFRKGARMGMLVRHPRKALLRKVRIIETGEVFATVEQLARYISGDTSSIYRVLREERPSHKGYSFEYVYEGA